MRPASEGEARSYGRKASEPDNHHGRGDRRQYGPSIAGEGLAGDLLAMPSSIERGEVMSVRIASRRSRGVFATLVVALCGVAVAATGATAAEATKSYIVLMGASPAIAYEGGVAGIPATKPGKGKKIDPDADNVQRYRGHLQAQHNQTLTAVGGNADQKLNDYSIALNGYSALLTEAQAAALENVKGVAAVQEDQLKQATTDSSPAFLGLTAAGGAYAQGIDGSGVVVGVIDTGIWPEHPSFSGAGLPAPPTGPLPCEFGNTAGNPNDAPFTCNNKLIGAYEMLDTYRALIGADPDEYESARDDNGHGTHTSSTAAGNANVPATVVGTSRGRISGIAPRAHIIMYKGLGNLGGFTSDLAAAIDQAVEDGVDVINYSIGGGCAVGNCPVQADELAFLFAADAGVFVAVSAGNSGPGAGTIGSPSFAPWVTTVGASTQRRFFQGTVTLGNGASYAGASITQGIGSRRLVDAASHGNALCSPAVTFTPALPANAIVLCQRGTVARIAKSRAVKEQNGVGMIMFENSDTGNLFTDTHHVPSVHVDNTPGLAIKAYIAAQGAGATASIAAEQVSNWPFAPSMTDFSSRGPNNHSGDFLKPDVTAPGIQILAGTSPTPDPATVPPAPGVGEVTGQLFMAIAGTSMSSPHVAGLYALLKEANPSWSASAAKSALMTTAYQSVLNNDRVNQATPFAQGAGHVNPGRPQNKGSAFQPGIVYEAGFNEYLAALCDTFPAIFTNPNATCAALQGAGFSTKAYNLNLPSIGVGALPGQVTVKRTVTSVAEDSGNRTYTVSVVEPDGYDISVSPSSFSLKSGESRSYEVTITNVSAPIGVFRFGSLTWNEGSGSYKAYTPIAVRGSAFAAPAEVSGTGGPISYNVNFGYTGSFTANAHGLVAATTSNHTILDDPTDSSCSLSTPNSLQVPVTIVAGTPVARFALFDDFTDGTNTDLDLCVFRGTTNVGSSGGSTAQEQVTLLNPTAGAYTVVVAPFATDGPDANFTLFQWLPTTAVGNMNVSAPASATSGTTGTINLTFSGLAPTTKYLGAVSYTGVPGGANPTIVRVDTP
jgi:subtilisin family serine protease